MGPSPKAIFNPDIKQYKYFILICDERNHLLTFRSISKQSAPGRGGTPLYKLCVLPQRVWFLSRFGLKTDIDFDNFSLKSGYRFQGNNESV